MDILAWPVTFFGRKAMGFSYHSGELQWGLIEQMDHAGDLVEQKPAKSPQRGSERHWAVQGVMRFC